MVKIKVFVSSLIKELQEERTIAKKAITNLHLEPWIFEEKPATHHTPESFSLQNVNDCDIFIQILTNDISNIVQEEYEIARKCGKKILIFVGPENQTRALKTHIKKIDNIYKRYKTLQQLKQIIHESLLELLKEGFISVKGETERRKDKLNDYIDNKLYSFESSDKIIIEYELKTGDQITGLINCISNKEISVYFMDEESYVNFLNDDEFEYLGEENIISYRLNFQAHEDSTYYLIIQRNLPLIEWAIPNVQVKLRRMRYE